MLVDKTDRKPHDMTRVGLEEQWEVDYWCSRFNVGEADLRTCVLKVGPRVDDVTQHLTRNEVKSILKNTGED
ncbi:MAG: DUF3606 domain-containing protein [Pseudomonadota bacterium]